MNKIHNDKVFYQAVQLIKIAQIETGKQISAENSIVVGDNKTAEAITDMIGCKHLKAYDDIVTETAENRFNAVFLFADISEEYLRLITENNAVVIDMTEYRNGDTVFYSCSEPYRRIRVVSLFEDKNFES